LAFASTTNQLAEPPAAVAYAAIALAALDASVERA
jgi:hypothetical protein